MGSWENMSIIFDVNVGIKYYSCDGVEQLMPYGASIYFMQLWEGYGYYDKFYCVRLQFVPMMVMILELDGLDSHEMSLNEDDLLPKFDYVVRHYQNEPIINISHDSIPLAIYIDIKNKKRLKIKHYIPFVMSSEFEDNVDENLLSINKMFYSDRYNLWTSLRNEIAQHPLVIHSY